MRLRLALDTNRCTDFHRGDAAVTHVLEQADEILVPFAVIAELRVGFAGGSRCVANEQAFQRFLARPRVAPLYPADTTTHHYAAVYQGLRTQGTPIPTNDIWIAALCLQHNLTLYARDAHFDFLPRLQRI